MKAVNILFVVLLLSSVSPEIAAAQPLDRQFDAGVFFTHVFLEEIGSTDHGVGSSTAGLGGRIVWHPVRLLDIEGELAVHPDAGVRGHRIQGFVGAKSGVRFNRAGIFAKVRPGFLYFSKDPFGVAEQGSTFLDTRWADSFEPALDVGLVGEYYGSNGLLIRLDVADTIVSYEERTVVASQREPRRQVAGFTTHNRQWSLGIGMRF